MVCIVDRGADRSRTGRFLHRRARQPLKPPNPPSLCAHHVRGLGLIPQPAERLLCTTLGAGTPSPVVAVPTQPRVSEACGRPSGLPVPALIVTQSVSDPRCLIMSFVSAIRDSYCVRWRLPSVCSRSKDGRNLGDGRLENLLAPGCDLSWPRRCLDVWGALPPPVAQSVPRCRVGDR